MKQIKFPEGFPKRKSDAALKLAYLVGQSRTDNGDYEHYFYEQAARALAGRIIAGEA